MLKIRLAGTTVCFLQIWLVARRGHIHFGGECVKCPILWPQDVEMSSAVFLCKRMPDHSEFRCLSKFSWLTGHWLDRYCDKNSCVTGYRAPLQQSWPQTPWGLSHNMIHHEFVTDIVPKYTRSTHAISSINSPISSAKRMFRKCSGIASHIRSPHNSLVQVERGKGVTGLTSQGGFSVGGRSKSEGVSST